MRTNAVILIVCALLVLGALGLWVYSLVTYANKPITEVPFWALYFLGK